MRIALGIEYDGSQFHGWQKQHNLRTVQGSLESALSRIVQHDIEVTCAGRTDTGVHAVGQVVHFDTDVKRPIQAWIAGSNTYLPQDVCVRWAKVVSDQFHARYSAESRTYRYIIVDEPIRPALFRRHATWQFRKLCTERMAEASQALLGEHDFTSFRSSDCQALTPRRYVRSIDITRQEPHIYIDITANAFLHHMVRNIVGVLIRIGNKKMPVTWAKEVLDARDRRLGAETAPPYGLYFMRVHYPSMHAIPEGSQNGDGLLL